MRCRGVVLGKGLKIKEKAEWEVPKKIEINGGFYHIFRFGVAVFYDLDDEQIKKAMVKLGKNVEEKNILLGETYEIKIKKGKIMIKNDVITIPSKRYLPLVSFLVAQREALIAIDKELDDLIENLEDIIDYFETSRFYLFSKPYIKRLLKAIKLRNYLLFDLMVGDLPEALLINDEAYKIYDYFYKELDVEELYVSINTKLDSILESVTYINELIAVNKEVLLELIIVILIAVEILMAFAGFW